METFYVYIITNASRRSLYIGITNDLGARLKEHYDNRGLRETWAGRYYCYNLIGYEEYHYINDAIAREKQLKKWNRAKKERLIAIQNPQWNFLNVQLPFEDRLYKREIKGIAVLFY